MNEFEKNRSLNDREFEEGQLVLKSRPRELLVILTTRCNLQCIMCTRAAGDKVLPEEKAFALLSLFPMLETVDWQGGEVFCVDYFQKLVEEAGRYANIKQWITTSGVLITRPWADTLARAGVSLAVSIDGVTRKTYESIRRGASFDRLCQCLGFINEARGRYSRVLRLELHATVMRSNHREIEQFMDFAKKFRFDLVSFKPVLYVPETENIFSLPDSDALNYLRGAKGSVFQKARDFGIGLSWALPDSIGGEAIVNLDTQRRRQFISSEKDKGALEIPCRKPWKKMVIDISREGNIYPECYCMTPSGNLLTDGFELVWNGPMMQEYRRRLVERRGRGFCSEACMSGQVDPAILDGNMRKESLR